MILSDVQNIFLDKITLIPQNLRTTCLALAGVFFLINTALMIFKVDEIDWLKWLLNITLKVGFVIWIIDNYSYLIGEILNGFILISNSALGLHGTGANNFIRYPSLLIDKGIDMANSILYLVNITPSSWIYAVVSFISFLGYAFIGFMNIITVIEFYLLTGISIIFIPFGLLDVTKSYYLNVFKTITGCSIKLCVLNLILNLSTQILGDLTLQEQTFEGALQAMVIILLLAYFVISIPSLATALMTGTPTSSATEALRLGMSAVTAMSTTLTAAYLMGKGGVEGANETGSGMSKGMDTGGHIGGSIGGAVGGLFGAGGMALGQKLGATVGSATGGMVGGMYSAGKWGAKTAHGKMAGNSNPRSHANWGTDSSSSGANQGTKTDTGSERSTILNGESSKEN